MNKLGPGEVRLVGGIEAKTGVLKADVNWERILWLTKEELVELARDASGWCILYRDPQDGRLWELSYPDSGSHGGGAPELRVVTRVEAERKYALL